MVDPLPQHVEAAACEPQGDPFGGGGVLLAVLFGLSLAWALWPVPAPTADERRALGALDVTVMAPGKVVCPVTTVPLRWSPDVGRAIGYDRWLLLNKAGWRFLVPVAAVKVDVTDGVLGAALPSSAPESLAGRVVDAGRLVVEL